MLAELLKGDAWSAWIAVAIVLTALSLEALATTRVWPWFFRVGFPLGTSVVPVATQPPDEGDGLGVAWKRIGATNRIAFWASTADGRFPRGVHGVATLHVDRGGRVHVDVTWAPWWTPLTACAWLSALGVSRGDGWFAVPIAMMLTSALLFVYHRAAMSVVRALRFAWQEAHSQGGRPS